MPPCWMPGRPFSKVRRRKALAVLGGNQETSCKWNMYSNNIQTVFFMEWKAHQHYLDFRFIDACPSQHCHLPKWCSDRFHRSDTVVGSAVTLSHHLQGLIDLSG